MGTARTSSWRMKLRAVSSLIALAPRSMTWSKSSPPLASSIKMKYRCDCQTTRGARGVGTGHGVRLGYEGPARTPAEGAHVTLVRRRGGGRGEEARGGTEASGGSYLARALLAGAVRELLDHVCVVEALEDRALLADGVDAHPARVDDLDRGRHPGLGVLSGERGAVATLTVLLGLVDGEPLEHLLNTDKAVVECEGTERADEGVGRARVRRVSPSGVLGRAAPVGAP